MFIRVCPAMNRHPIQLYRLNPAHSSPLARLLRLKNSSIIEGAPNITANHRDKSNFDSVNPGDSLLYREDSITELNFYRIYSAAGSKNPKGLTVSASG